MDELSHDALKQKVRDLENELAQRLQAESRLRFQNDICRVLSTTIGRLNAWRRLLEVIVALDGIDAGCIYFVNRSSGEINLVSHTGLSSSCLTAVSHYEAGSYQASLIRAGKPFYASPDRFLPGYSKIHRIGDLQAIGVIPVIDDGQVIGMLLVASRTHPSIPADTRADLEAGTALLGGFLARANSKKNKWRRSGKIPQPIRRIAGCYRPGPQSHH